MPAEKAQHSEFEGSEPCVHSRAQPNLELVLSALQDQFYTLDREWRYGFVNGRAARVLGRSTRDLVGCRIWDLAPELKQTRFFRELQACAVDREPRRFELARGDAWFEYSIYPTEEGVAVLATDVSSRKRGELALRESEARFRSMADNAPMMVWVTTPDGSCTFLSKSWYDFTGQTPATGLGFGWVSAVHPDDRERALAQFAAANRSRSAFRLDYRLRRKDGRFRWAVDSAVPWLSGAGDFFGYIGSVIDITERKDMEDALREADRRKDEFLAVLAHELRNPLAPLSNALQLMGLGGFARPEQVRAYELMQRQLGTLVRLVDDLLDVGRITRGKLELRKQRVGLAEVIGSAVELSQPLIDAGRHELRIALPDAAVELDGDPVRLSQVFANVLNNSAKYTPAGGRIELDAQLKDGGVAVQVRDTGTGISPDLLPHVFEMFSQARRVRESRAAGGLGVGLALVKGLVEAHGGRVHAASEGPGRGSTFTVWLPCEARPEARPSSRPELRKAERECNARPSPGRVLVVDDSPDSADTMAELLQLLGHEVRSAYGGAEAVEAARTFEPEFILMDIGMPVMDGLEAARRIRQLPMHKRPTIAAMTGWGQAEDRLRSQQAGIDAHLVKPVSVEALKLLLEDEAHMDQNCPESSRGPR